MSHKAFIALGTNIEPRFERIHQALSVLGNIGKIERQSAIYETAPVGVKDQPDFLNAVVEMSTELDPMYLLAALRKFEIDLGRKERERWHEREIDFDILFYDNQIITEKNLVVPHPEMQYRSFVLVPLAEIAPELQHPVFGKTMEEMLRDLGALSTPVQKVEKSNSPRE